MNDSLIFLVLAILAGIFKWLTTRGAEAEKPQSPSPNEPTLPAPPQNEQERVRRFLEALGAPPSSQPPPPIRPRPVAPRQVITPGPRPRAARARWAQPLPPLTTVPAPEPMAERQTPAPSLPTAPLSPAPPIPLPRPRPLPDVPVLSGVVPLASLGKLLRMRGSVRQAIVLREVLGPPRGLQALDDLRSF